MSTIVTRSGKGSPLTNTEVDANFTNLNTGKAELSGAVFTGAITTNSTIDGRDVATDGTKLDGVEASADVTDTANVTAAGALMDSELTSIASVKALNQGVATGDSPTFAGINASGNLTLDVAGKIILDADDSGTIWIQDAGTIYGVIEKSSSDFVFRSGESDGDIVFKGNDGGSTVAALTLDMSAAGAATFNSEIRATSATINSKISIYTDSNGAEIDNNSGNFTIDTPGDIILDADGGDVILKNGGTHWGSIYTNATPAHLYIQSMVQDQDIILAGFDGASSITALTLDMSAAGNATFNGTVLASNGTASLPSLSFSGDSNTGIYRSGSDNLGFAIGGQARAFMSATQFNMTGNGIFSGNGTFGGTLGVTGAATFNAGATSGGGITATAATAGSASANGLVKTFTADIGNGETNGINLYNSAGSDTSWFITPGVTGVNNTDFCIRDGTNNVNALRLAVSSGAAIFNSTIAATSATFTPSSGETVVLSRDSAGPYFGNSSNHGLRIITNNASRINISNSGNISTHPPAGNHFVINEDGIDSDFRVESDTKTHALFVAGDTGYVGIGLAPTHNFNLQSAGAVEARFQSTDGDCSLQISSDTDEGQDSILNFLSGTSGRGSITYDHNTTAASQAMIFKTGDNGVLGMTILGNGNVAIGNRTNPQDLLHLYDPNDDCVLNLDTEQVNKNSVIKFSDPAAQGRGFLQYAHSDDSFRIHVDGGEKTRIHSNGVLTVPAGIALLIKDWINLLNLKSGAITDIYRSASTGQ